MKPRIKEMIREAVHALSQEGAIKTANLPEIIIEKSRKDEFGDFATNVAMLLTPLEKRPPREIAALIAHKVAASALVKKCDCAGPGFINIFLKEEFWFSILKEILDRGAEFGRCDVGKGKKVLLEFVSANPTGPLHIGHGRGAAVGDALARILGAAGHEVTKEFYVNDIGKQVFTLGRSVYYRCLELQKEKKEVIDGFLQRLQDDYYKGAYIRDVAEEYLARLGGKGETLDANLSNLPQENWFVINSAGYALISFAKGRLLDAIKKDLADFGVEFDGYFSEASLYKPRNIVDETIASLKDSGFAFDDDGALWLKTMELANDDKDRVLIKADGAKTYLASDVAYHRDKLDRGFDILVNVWGADHHGYEARIRAALKAFGHDPDKLRIIFIQLVALLRNGVPVPMGKREGEFVTLRQVMDEVGTDACRFFFLMRKSDAQLDFDLELAKSQAPENPVYYVQYAHARIKSIMAHAGDAALGIDADALNLLKEKDEINLIKHLALFEEAVERAAVEMEPHRVTYYLTELAGIFHPYYNKHRVVTGDPGLTAARIQLCKAAATVIANGLTLLGVSAPDKM
ncbi:MAG: arginine--tRNA ligase [Deltaproteobacteria bacterium]|nr:arginine--tRNA ligase [Deltaproteobacteria bacterium]